MTLFKKLKGCSYRKHNHSMWSSPCIALEDKTAIVVQRSYRILVALNWVGEGLLQWILSVSLLQTLGVVGA